MPRPFEITTESNASVGQVHAAFSSEQYWRARLLEFGGESIRLDSLIVDDGGGVVVHHPGPGSRHVAERHGEGDTRRADGVAAGKLAAR